MDAVARYLIEVNEIRCTGSNVPETSFYPALSNLFNEIGKSLSPKVRCVINLKNRGAGLPDGGLFTADQFKGKGRGPKDPDDPFPAQIPARGALEVKPPSDDLGNTLASEQVERYWKEYGLVLVTNLRSFSLVGKSPTGQPAILESFALADTDVEFWKLASHPKATANRCGDRLTEFLRRAMLYNAPLASAQDVAALLASYARDAASIVETADLPALGGLRSALEDALGLKFEGAKGEHFFRSTLVQTLFYGIFSAWVLWARRQPDMKVKAKTFGERIKESADPYKADSKQFDWHLAGWLLRVPMIRALFEQVATPSKLGPLGLTEILDRTTDALNRVDRASFFASFDAGQAVQYFYEPFLQAFDPVLRKDLGVWYTPSEIVAYQVERVDRVLREELDIPDGLADPRVYVLDPCCGTATYLRAVILRIARTLEEKGSDALMAHDLKKAAMDRVFGFEILPAPFVVSHLQLGLLLDELGAPLSESKAERVGIYLTNALTGWEPPKEKPKQIILLPELAEERDAAEKVKQERPILVILGNPPYNGFAGMAMDEERDLSSAYRIAKKVMAPQGQGLNDLYVRFFRMAERRIVEKNGQGIVCFISNYSWLDGLSFTGMRERYMDVFDEIVIDCLNGDKYKTGKLTPEGAPDPSIFSTEFNREGIQVGTAIALLVRNERHDHCNTVRFRQFWGKNKRTDLLADKGQYEDVKPVLELGLSFLPGQVAAAYVTWHPLPELFPISLPGVKTSRDDFLVAVDRAELDWRLADYFNPDLSHEEIARRYPEVMTDSARFQSRIVREHLLKRGGPLTNKIVRFCYRPLDVRWLYWEPDTELLDRKRSDYFPQVFTGNVFLCAVQQNRKAFDPPVITDTLACFHTIERGANLFPLRLRSVAGEQDLFAAESEVPALPQSNLTPEARKYLQTLGLEAETLFYHVVAVLHAPAYGQENTGALRQDWPRLPLPADKDLLLSSAALGRQVAALLETEKPVPGVTEGKIPENLRQVAVFEKIGGGVAKPDEGDLDLTAGWGHAGKGGITMPGRGRVADHGDTLDIYLNDQCCWRNVPKAVWTFTIGGYQVIKKWLSYREKTLLGRGLTIDEVRYVTEMARRLKAITNLQPPLDESYRKIAGNTYR
ncbi:MAG: DNA methyltransferase [Deltaproteobacteria bacterium HGW-Deltaproteobacteria-19]|nr:MAG: DNA methyltransferase [Deltaproteobacteria bacterium HGW-Deltaproteobacteria-19]